MTPVLFLASLAASAQGLQWQWGGSLDYHAELVVGTPQGHRYLGSSNIDARAISQELVFDVSCDVEEDGRHWAWNCDLSNVAMAGLAFQGEQDRLDQIFTEYSAILEEAQVVLNFKEDGRLRQLDLQGVNKHDDRLATIYEYQRQLLLRAFAVLDVQMPKDGVTSEKGWKQKGSPTIFGLITAYGTVGGYTLSHQQVSEKGNVVTLQSEGRGNVATGLDMDAQTHSIINLVVAGNSRFDTEEGHLLFSMFQVDGRESAQAAESNPQAYMASSAWMGLRNPDGSIEGFEEDTTAP